MPPVGHDSPVQCYAQHEPTSNLLGPHGAGKPQVIASAEGDGWFEAEHCTEVTAKENTSTDERAADENSLQPTYFLRSHHSTLLKSRRSRRSDSLSIFVSNQFNMACSKIAPLPRISE